MTSAPSADQPRISFVSLGCPKALVDSERIITQLRAEGYEVTRSHAGADAVIVNTCGFLDSAKAESLDAIGAALKENGKVIVTGCMGAEPEQIRDRFPNVLAITGPQAYESVMGAVRGAVPSNHDPFIDLVPDHGIKLTPRHYAYLKISEGCNNRCSFCIIPKLRGDLVSRPAGDVLREAEKLVAAGVKELLVISQDTSAYGLDLKYAESAFKDRSVRARFYDLSKELGSLGAWVRLHYVYPYPHVDEVLQLMADGLVLPYLDIPFQHASPQVLKAMKRPGNQDKTLERIRKWREICPDLAIRSTFIVGFPGETEEDFQETLRVVEAARFALAFTFQYSIRPGTPAATMPDQVPKEVVQERFERLVALQNHIAFEENQAQIGRSVDVLVANGEGKKDVARHRMSGRAPDMRLVHFEIPDGAEIPRPGDVVTVTITEAAPYHLLGDTGYSLRRTRAGDAWDRAQAESCGVPVVGGASTSASTSTATPVVGLGMPSRRPD